MKIKEVPGSNLIEIEAKGGLVFLEPQGREPIEKIEKYEREKAILPYPTLSNALELPLVVKGENKDYLRIYLPSEEFIVLEIKKGVLKGVLNLPEKEENDVIQGKGKELKVREFNSLEGVKFLIPKREEEIIEKFFQTNEPLSIEKFQEKIQSLVISFQTKPNPLFTFFPANPNGIPIRISFRGLCQIFRNLKQRL